ncbi:hypothetical protein BGW42_005679 [Actinomortierella wolfii]|nr:hypothetical protein BGW42_005679 [Actinomortierella wolfii]
MFFAPEALMNYRDTKFPEIDVNICAIDGSQNLPDDMKKNLIERNYQAVFMSLEAAFSRDMAALWRKEAWRSKMLAIVFDKAHCTSTWNKEIKEAHTKIEELRTIMSSNTAFVAVSTTVHGEILEGVKKNLQLKHDVRIIRADADRPNVRYVVKMTNGDIQSCYQALEVFLDSKKTIIYFDDKRELMNAYRHLTTKVKDPESTSLVRSLGIVTYFADMSSNAKALYMKKFRGGKVHVMLSNDASDMGYDIPDIRRVVQFRFPRSILILAQRLGRAGILLYPSSDAERLETMDATLSGFVTARCRKSISTLCLKISTKGIQLL